MSRRGGYDDWYYPPSQPIKADGIKAKGTFGTSWWAKRWIKALETLGIGSRLARGRSYARNGQVLGIDIQPGKVAAQVQGSRPKPYRVKIQLAPLRDAQWDGAIAAMAGQAIFAAKLLAGEMPQNIEDAFQQAGVALFPRSAGELVTECNCADWENPCKHIAAVYYLLGESFDEDPFLIFQLRGRSREQIIAALRELRNSGDQPDAEIPTLESAPQLADLLASFYQAGPDLDSITAHIATPEVAAAPLKRLGAPPANTEVDLRVLYAAMSRWVQSEVFGDEEL